MFMSSSKKIHAVIQGNDLGCFFGTKGCLCRCEGKKTEIGAPQNVVRTKEPRLTLKKREGDTKASGKWQTQLDGGKPSNA